MKESWRNVEAYHIGGWLGNENGSNDEIANGVAFNVMKIESKINGIENQSIWRKWRENENIIGENNIASIEARRNESVIAIMRQQYQQWQSAMYRRMWHQ